MNALATLRRLVVFAVLGAPLWTAEAAAARLYSGEYSLACWLNGWRKHASDASPEVLAIQASRYAFTLDLADFTQAGYEAIAQQSGRPAASYRDALGSGTEHLHRLPAAEVRIALDVDGTRYTTRSCAAGTDRDPRRLGAAKLWESGRFVQHFELEGLQFEDAAGRPLPIAGSLFVVAWPDSLTLTVSIRPPASHTWKTARLEIAFQGQGFAEVAEQAFEFPDSSSAARTVSLTVGDARGQLREPADGVSIQVTHGANTTFPVVFDAVKNCIAAAVPRVARTFQGGYTDIRDYDDFLIAIENRGEAEVEIPFLLEFRNPANITGLCPILCDTTGRPTGIPVQLSKNWHHGEYLMGYTRLPAQPGRSEYLLRVVYGFYGTLPSASHAQLSLIGYSPRGGNGRWDQLAIGCWGETFCLDMDMSLVDIAITDVRCLMVRQGAGGAMWGWTDGGWGGDWLGVHDSQGRKLYFAGLKTAYLAHGPCLSDVRYHGHYGRLHDVDLQATVHTLRTDDYARTFHRLQYTFQRTLSAHNSWLFKMGRTGGLVTPQVAYGNVDGLLVEREVPESLPPKDLLVDTTTLDGNGPWWVAFPGAAHPNSRMADGSRALVIRSYKATFAGKTYRQPTIRMPVFAARNVDLLLVPPDEVAEYQPGDAVELDLEWITLPRTADDYYGPNEALRQHLAEQPGSWKTVYREARGNDLQLAVAGGVVRSVYPILIRADRPVVQVSIRGGVGYVPLRFEGLETAHGWALYRTDGGSEIKLEQAVHGNDFWQTDYDAGSQTFQLTFNLPLDGQAASTWTLKRP